MSFFQSGIPDLSAPDQGQMLDAILGQQFVSPEEAENEEPTEVPDEPIVDGTSDEPEQPTEPPAPTEPIAPPEIPEWMPEEFRIPEKFATAESELEFYRQKYRAMADHFGSSKVIENWIERYGDKLAEADQSVEGFAQFYQAFKKDPVAALAAHIPHIAPELGLPQELEPKEVAEVQEKLMAEEFGENWRDLFNPRDADLNPNSISAMMRAKAYDIQNFFAQQNKQAQVQREQFRQAILRNITQPQQQANELPPEQEQALFLEAANKTLKPAGVPEAEFENLYQHIKTKGMNLLDAYRSMTYEQAIEKARQEGIALGRKAAVDDLRRVRQPQIVRPSDEPEESMKKPSRTEIDQYFRNKTNSMPDIL